MATVNILEFLHQKTIVITGATGFVGKVLLEKLLWESCQPSGPFVNIRLMVRNPEGKTSIASRFEQLMRSEAFDRLRGMLGNRFAESVQSRVQLIEADLDLVNFGLADKDYALLCESVDVIFHVAALVKWDAPLDASLRSNALGSQHVAELARSGWDTGRCPRVVFVSTAWVHGMRTGACEEKPMSVQSGGLLEGVGALNGHQEIDLCFKKFESVQAESVTLTKQFLEEASRRIGLSSDPAEISHAAEEMRLRWVSDQMSQYGVEQARSRGWWDGYTFSKAVGEQLAGEILQGIPYAIVRPSGVAAAAAEPAPGWVDAYLLVEPLIEGVGRGQIQEFPGKPDCVIDLVPVDYVCNAILAAAAHIETTSSSTQVQVYQCASGDICPVTLLEIEASWRAYFECSPFKDTRGKPIRLAPVRFATQTQAYIDSMHRKYVMPLRILEKTVELAPYWDRVEFLRKSRGWLSRKRRGVEKILSLAKLYSTYTTNEWAFKTSNTRQLMTTLTPNDKTHFPYFDLKSDPKEFNFDWDAFWSSKHIPGMRRWVLREGDVHSMTQIPSKL